jgi:nucleotide-binding universal stress UspA family protein
MTGEERAMYKKILVPVDLTDKPQRTVDVAAELAVQGGGNVTLLHVIELIPGLGFEEERPFYDRLDRLSRKHFERLVPQLSERKVPWHTQVLYGPRAATVVRHAVEAGHDLIVVASHPIDLNNPTVGWGTVSYQIGILSQCAVLLVK